MKTSWLLLLSVLFVCWSAVSMAAEWTFSEPVPVTAEQGDRVFHHLEPAGRRSIASSGDTIAVAWEDDRDGVPRVYLARRQASDKGFSTEIKISGDGEAFDPVIVGLTDSRFMIAWEEEGQVLLRIVSPKTAGTAIKLSATGSQPSITRYGNDAVVVWSERAGQYGQIQMARTLVVGAKIPVIKERCPAEKEEAKDEQLYPAVTEVAGELVVAWEDRRPGHTIIMAAHGKPCQLTAPVRISAAIEQSSVTYGKGHGVSRVALTTYGADRVLATWADKRDFREGYDIYAAAFQPRSGFGENMHVQDEFGGVARQWHPTAAGHDNGNLVVVWTDEREDNSDLMYSTYVEGEWSEDIPLPGAWGAGEQGHPSVIFDNAGRLHVVWIERTDRNSPTRLKYMVGNMKDE
jgi:hypothetical protein